VRSTRLRRGPRGAPSLTRWRIQPTRREFAETHPRAAPAEGPVEPDAPQGSRRAGPSRPPARHAPRIPSPAASLRPRAASVSRRFAPPRPGRAASAEVHFGRPGTSLVPRGVSREGAGLPPPGPALPALRPNRVGAVTARGCRERAAYGSAASASRPREQLKARHAGCEPGHTKPLRVHCSGLGAPAQPPRRASLQRWRLSARRSMPWQCGREATLRSSRAGQRPALGHLRARSLPPGRTRTRSTTQTTTATRTTRTRPTGAAAKRKKQLEPRRRPAATRRRGDRMGSAISGTPRSGPQPVKDARSARLAEPIP
jgi:hypothetical protein